MLKDRATAHRAMLKDMATAHRAMLKDRATAHRAMLKDRVTAHSTMLKDRVTAHSAIAHKKSRYDLRRVIKQTKEQHRNKLWGKALCHPGPLYQESFNSSHPSHRLFSLLPHGKRCQCIKSDTRLLNSFYPQAIRLLNS